MYLMDTHCFLWYLRNSPELSERALAIIDSAPDIYVSIVSLWEIAIKKSIGKLGIEQSMTQLEELCAEKYIALLPIKSKHLDWLGTLEKYMEIPLIVSSFVRQSLSGSVSLPRTSSFLVMTI